MLTWTASACLCARALHLPGVPLRTTEVHKSQLRQAQLEVGELQRSLAAKEREADGLRGSLAAAKRGYEQRLEHMESQLAARDAEVRAHAQGEQLTQQSGLWLVD
jgi:hypothetical protein